MAHQHTAEGLYIAVLRQLADVAWAPGSRLPGTRRLAREMRTSHIAVQTALRRAARHGLLDVRQRHRVVKETGHAHADQPEAFLAKHLLAALACARDTPPGGDSLKAVDGRPKASGAPGAHRGGRPPERRREAGRLTALSATCPAGGVATPPFDRAQGRQGWP